MNKSKLSILCLVLIFVLFISSSNISGSQQFSQYKESIAGSDIIIEMKAIDGGNYNRGSLLSEKGRSDNEGPVSEIYIDDFWISSCEITWDQYQLFLYREIDGVEAPDRGDLNLKVDGVSGATMPYVNFNRPGHSVVNITQYAASTFCKWLTAKTGRFYRLPTEAEWEYACRSGHSSAFSFGENVSELGRYAWFDQNSKRTFHKPGEKLPNQWGLYDMHGNVAEWVIDSYQSDAYSMIKDPSNPVVFGDDLYPRVVRGGSWKDSPGELRSAARGYSDKSWKKRDPQFPKSLWSHTDATHVGFRIVRPKSTPTKEKMEKFWGQPIEEY